MAFSAPSGTQSATTTGAALRPYDGGTFTLTGMANKIRVDIAQTQPYVAANNSDGIYRVQWREKTPANDGAWQHDDTAAMNDGVGYLFIAASYEIEGLADATEYEVRLQLDNLT